VTPCWPEGTALVASVAVCRIVISSVMLFSLSALLLAGTQRRVGPARQAKGSILRGKPRNVASIVLFLGGTANPEGGEADAAVPPAQQEVFPSSRCPREARLKRRVEETTKAGENRAMVYSV